MAKDDKKQQIDKRRRTYEIPVKGSLGILAAGYKGILAWRNVIAQSNKSEKS